MRINNKIKLKKRGRCKNLPKDNKKQGNQADMRT